MYLSSFCLTLCVVKLDKTTLFPNLEGVASCRNEPYLSTLPQLLLVLQTTVIVQAAFFIFSGS